MKDNLKFITSMFIFGSIGIFVRYIEMASSVIALIRGGIGVLCLITISFLMKRKISVVNMLENKWILLASGLALGVNWIFLFEAFRNTTIAVATLSYYLTPIIIVILSPFVLKEKLSAMKIACVMAALLGMVLISGVLSPQQGAGSITGVLCGVAAAVSYASLTLMNKFIKSMSSLDATIAQLAIAALVLLPYTLFTKELFEATVDHQTIFLLVVLGVVHTGIAFWLYFASIQVLKTQSIALFSYIDPLTAIALSALLLKEKITAIQIVGAIFILGSAFISEKSNQ